MKAVPPDQVAYTDGLDRPGGYGHGCVLHVTAPDQSVLSLPISPSDGLPAGGRHDCSDEYLRCVRDIVIHTTFLMRQTAHG